MEIGVIHRRLGLVLRLILVLEAVIAIWEGQWLTVAITSGIIFITLIPRIMAKRYVFYIPPEFELFSITFIFCSLFLGEVRGYYDKFWWWDLALHSTSGLLLGMIGFLLVHLLNETKSIALYMKPGFVAFFAFLFSIGIGMVWEIFEFAMDQLFGMNMQKPMLGDPSGLTDTMWDLIIDTVGALIISIIGYGYLKSRRKDSYLLSWIEEFIHNNPRFFRRG